MELPAVMASLQIEENKSDADASSAVAEPVTEPVASPYSLRKRASDTSRILKLMKRARISPEAQGKLNTDEDIMEYYIKVNKKCSVKQSNLETIFEEPKESSDGNVVTMSGAKVRRSIVFSGRVTKGKKLKRSAKMKKFQLTGSKPEKKQKLSLDEVKLRLTLVDSSE